MQFECEHDALLGMSVRHRILKMKCSLAISESMAPP